MNANIPIPSLASLNNFETAASAVLKFLHSRLGFGLWMVTRKDGNDWIVLQAEGHGYGVQAETVFSWSDSFCSRMVAGFGPRVAPRAASIQAYVDAGIHQQLKVGSYVGVPLHNSDGSLFGTLCAIDPEQKPDALRNELPLVELLAAMLSCLLQTELRAVAASRRADWARAEAEMDVMTGVYNRRGWNRLLEAEEARCRRYGNSACIIVADLNGLKAVNDSLGHAAGDKMICRAARAIRNAARESDVVARLGGDEFAVMGTECSNASARDLLERIRVSLAKEGVTASLGLAVRVSGKGLPFAFHEADMAMYCEKADSAKRHVVYFKPALAS